MFFYTAAVAKLIYFIPNFIVLWQLTAKLMIWRWFWRFDVGSKLPIGDLKINPTSHNQINLYIYLTEKMKTKNKIKINASRTGKENNDNLNLSSITVGMLLKW